MATTAEVIDRLAPWHTGNVPVAVPSAARGRDIPAPPRIGQTPTHYTPDEGDTQPSFVIATFLPHELGDDDSISQASQGTFPMAAAAEETQRSMSRIRSTLDHFERQGIPRSVTILIALAAVVAVVCLAAVVAGY